MKREEVVVVLSVDGAEGLADHLANSRDRGFQELSEWLYEEIERIKG